MKTGAENRRYIPEIQFIKGTNRFIKPLFRRVYQMRSSDYPVEARLAGYIDYMHEGVDYPRMTAAEKNNQTVRCGGEKTLIIRNRIDFFSLRIPEKTWKRHFKVGYFRRLSREGKIPNSDGFSVQMNS